MEGGEAFTIHSVGLSVYVGIVRLTPLASAWPHYNHKGKKAVLQSAFSS